MKTRLLLLLPLLSLSAAGDTIRLRNGTEYEGMVLREDGDDYIVAIQVTKSIRDERRIPKHDVLEIIGVKKDEVAWEELKSLVPTPDLLTEKDYNDRVRRIESFMTKFNTSSHLAAADEMLKVLDEERKIVAGGGVKFGGKMIEGSERASKAYALDAEIAAAKVQELGEGGDHVAALRAWEDFEKTYLGSSAYPETVPFAIRLMQTQLANVNRMLDTYDTRMQERQAGLERMEAKDRSRSEEQIAAESAAYARLVETERKENVRWPSLSPWHKEPLQSTKSRLEQEIKRLQSLDTSKLPGTESAWDDAWEVLSGKPDASAASSAISKARSAQLPDAYVKMLEKRAPAK